MNERLAIALVIIGVIGIALLVAAFLRARTGSKPLDDEHSDFTEPRRACPFGCGCRGDNITNEGAR